MPAIPEENTLVIIKPDAVQRGLVGKLISRIEDKGLKIKAMKFIQLNTEKAMELYQPHRDKPFFGLLIESIVTSPVVVMVVGGPAAISQIRKMMGATNCREAAPGTIRGDYGLDIQKNLIHGSDSDESASREIKVFFTPEDLVDYKKKLEEWIYPQDE